MNELIKIDQNGKVTARELYEFLQLAAGSFARWAKTNIEDNEFYQEGVDWDGFSIVLNGNETKDYRLTIDFGKHLCMLSRSERGKQARCYFIEAEKRYNAYISSPKSSAEMFSMQAQINLEYEQRLSELEVKTAKQDAAAMVLASKVDQIQEAQSKKADLTAILPPVNEKSLRANVNEIVRKYATRNKISFGDAFNALYKEFYYRYSMDLKVRAKNRNISPLDIAEKEGCLKDLLSLTVELFA